MCVSNIWHSWLLPFLWKFPFLVSSSSLSIPSQSPLLVSPLLLDLKIFRGPQAYSLAFFSSFLTSLVISPSFMPLNITYKLPELKTFIQLPTWCIKFDRSKQEPPFFLLMSAVPTVYAVSGAGDSNYCRPKRMTLESSLSLLSFYFFSHIKIFLVPPSKYIWNPTTFHHLHSYWPGLSHCHLFLGLSVTS